MNMKRIAAIMLAFASISGTAIAQDAFLQNRTDATLYVIDQVTIDLEAGASYRQIPVAGLLPFDPSRPVAGFAYRRGEFQLPTFVIEPADASELAERDASDRTYLPITDGMLVYDRVVSPAEFAPLLAMPRVDNQYLDWVGRDASVARGRSRAPLGVFADFGEGREETTLEDSLLWQRGGTDLQWIKAFADEGDYLLAASVYSPFGRGTSVFLYLYPPGAAFPAATVELPASRTGGSSETHRFALLWIPGQPAPRVVGNVLVEEYFLEAQIWRDGLASEALGDPARVSVEIATATSAAGVWEEFVLARIALEELFGE